MPPQNGQTPGNLLTRALPSAGYWATVYAQYRSNRLASWAMLGVATMFLMAVFAPVLAHDRPLLLLENGTWTSPLWRWLCAPTGRIGVDYFFNYLLFLLLSWAVVECGHYLFRRTGWNCCNSCYLRLPLPFLLAITPYLSLEYRTMGETEVFQYFKHYRLETRDYKNKLDDNSWVLFAPVPYDPLKQSTTILQAPNRTHWLGTDREGRDVLARILHGSRVSLAVGLVAVLLATVIGIVVGALAGYFRGWVDLAISRFIELVICFPTFFLIITVMALMEERSIVHVMIVIGLTGWTRLARLVRGEFLKLSELDYVQAARAMGCSSTRVMFRHMLPNAMGPVLVTVAFDIAGAVLIESALSYLGFGAPPPTATWGELIHQGKIHVFEGAWWLLYFPGLLIFFTVTVYNLVGDGLRDALDPRLKK